MFREMRRINQLMSDELNNAVLERNTNGILACFGEDGYPYGVPVNFAMSEGKIVFHSAKTGHKVDAIKENSKVSFTVVDEDTIISEEYTSYFRSVIAFGEARVLEEKERLAAMWAIIEKFSGAEEYEEKERVIVDDGPDALIVGVDIIHMTGKEAREYAEAK